MTILTTIFMPHYMYEVYENGRHRAIPENIHTYTKDGFQDFRRGRGVHDHGILRAWGRGGGGGAVFTTGNPKAWGDFTD